jgi:hypothetical protein
MSSMRQYMHDREQARRRTDAQNAALVKIIEDNEGQNETWSYSSVPPEGGPVELGRIKTGSLWTVDPDGTVTKS